MSAAVFQVVLMDASTGEPWASYLAPVSPVAGTTVVVHESLTVRVVGPPVITLGAWVGASKRIEQCAVPVERVGHQ